MYFPPTIDTATIDWDEFSRIYDDVQRQMRNGGAWFEDGHNYGFRRATSRQIALGRNQFYVQFADFLYEKYGTRFYLLDYMTRLDGVDGQQSLIYYIASASLIHINLEGVSAEHLRRATIGIGRPATKPEIGAPYTTAWEINYVFHHGLLDRTWFHTGCTLGRFTVFRSMGGRVPFRRILSDNRHLLSQYYREVADLDELSSP